MSIAHVCFSRKAEGFKGGPLCLCPLRLDIFEDSGAMAEEKPGDEIAFHMSSCHNSCHYILKKLEELQDKMKYEQRVDIEDLKFMKEHLSAVCDTIDQVIHKFSPVAWLPTDRPEYLTMSFVDGRSPWTFWLKHLTDESSYDHLMGRLRSEVSNGSLLPLTMEPDIGSYLLYCDEDSCYRCTVVESYPSKRIKVFNVDQGSYEIIHWNAHLYHSTTEMCTLHAKVIECCLWPAETEHPKWSTDVTDFFKSIFRKYRLQVKILGIFDEHPQKHLVEIIGIKHSSQVNLRQLMTNVLNALDEIPENVRDSLPFIDETVCDPLSCTAEVFTREQVEELLNAKPKPFSNLLVPEVQGNELVLRYNEPTTHVGDSNKSSGVNFENIRTPEHLANLYGNAKLTQQLRPSRWVEEPKVPPPPGFFQPPFFTNNCQFPGGMSNNRFFGSQQLPQQAPPHQYFPLHHSNLPNQLGSVHHNQSVHHPMQQPHHAMQHAPNANLRHPQTPQGPHHPPTPQGPPHPFSFPFNHPSHHHLYGAPFFFNLPKNELKREPPTSKVSKSPVVGANQPPKPTVAQVKKSEADAPLPSSLTPALTPRDSCVIQDSIKIEKPAPEVQEDDECESHFKYGFCLDSTCKKQHSKLCEVDSGFGRLSEEQGANTDEDLDEPLLFDGYEATDEKRICKFSRGGTCWKKGCTLEHVNEPSDVWTTDAVPVCIEAFNFLTMPQVNEEVEISVTEVLSPKSFYGILPDKYSDTGEGMVGAETIDSLMDALNKPSNSVSFNLLESKPALGQVVLAFSKSINQWVRGKASDVSDNDARIFCVDSGVTETVSLKNIRQIDPMFLHLPFQAVRCNLFNVEVREETMAEGTAFFARLVKGKVLTVRVMSRDMLLTEANLDVQLCGVEGTAILEDVLASEYCYPTPSTTRRRSTPRPKLSSSPHEIVYLFTEDCHKLRIEDCSLSQRQSACYGHSLDWPSTPFFRPSLNFIRESHNPKRYDECGWDPKGDERC